MYLCLKMQTDLLFKAVRKMKEKGSNIFAERLQLSFQALQSSHTALPCDFSSHIWKRPLPATLWCCAYQSSAVCDGVCATYSIHMEKKV